MATITLTSSGCSGSAVHDNYTADVTPPYYASFSLSASLHLSVSFSDAGVSWFNYDIGYTAVGSNGQSVSSQTRFAFGIADDGSGREWGYGKSVSLSGDLSGLSFPIELYFTCDGCGGGSWKDGNGAFTIIDGRHTHIGDPGRPTISATTGKTITVTDGEDGLYCTTNGSGWHGSTHTFTGLKQGTNYSFKCREYCPGCPDGVVRESSTVTGKTWNISGQFLTSGAKTMAFKATHVAGTGGDANSRNITYELYTSKNASGTPVATKNAANGIPVKFTNLDPGKTYYCYAYTTNLGNGDNNCWIEGGSTKEETTVTGNTSDVSATTLRASVSWNAGGATSVVCIIQCNGSSKNITSSGNYVGFLGLVPGTSYNVTWNVVSTYTYKYKYNVIENGTTVEKEDTITDVIETPGSITLVTKKTVFVESAIKSSSKIIQFASESVNTSENMEHKLSGGGWETVAEGEISTYDLLTHNTSYTIHSRIAGCFAFNESGGATTNNDSEISRNVSTKLLSLSVSISEEHQHSLVTLWQAYVGGIANDSDSIDGTLFRFTYMDTIARKNNPPYQSAEVIEGSNGNTTGNYQTDHKIYSNNLTWYYCEYIVTASLTDGYNVVANAITAHTIFPATWIHSGGQWHRYMGHVYTNNEFVPAPAFIYKNNRFSEPNGE